MQLPRFTCYSHSSLVSENLAMKITRQFVSSGQDFTISFFVLCNIARLSRFFFACF